MSQHAGITILVVDDEPEIVRALRTSLVRHNFLVDTACTGWEALESYARRRPDLVILDLELPDVAGVEVFRRLRLLGNTPVVVITAAGEEGDGIRALELGADDYFAKPFGMGELMARIHTALQYHSFPLGDTGMMFRTRELEVDLARRKVRVAGNEVPVTRAQYELLRTFVTHPNKLLTNRMLIRHVWGPENGDGKRQLHFCLEQLRRILQDDPQEPRYISTEPGVGYRFLAEFS